MLSTIKKEPRKSLLNISLIGLMIGATPLSHAGAFSIIAEANGVNVGNYGAGMAAEASDASIGYYNPAGLTRIHKEQVVGSLIDVETRGEFSGTATWDTFPFPTAAYRESFSGLDGGGYDLVPAFHYAKPISDGITFGLSITVPFGLSTDWDDTSAVRYAQTKTALMTVNVSPEIGGKVTDKLSLGAGLDMQYASVEMNAIVGMPGVLAGMSMPPAMMDSPSINKAHSLGVGAHVGLLYEFNPNTRVGLNYQSKISHRFTGTSSLTGPLVDMATGIPNSEFFSDNVLADMDFPASTTLSAFHQINQTWAIMGTVIYTQWDVFKDMRMHNISSPTGPITINIPQNFKNTWRAAVGVNYQATDKLMIRAGGGYDQTPTNDDIDRNLRLPDGNRFALAVGAHYEVSDKLALDAGWTHLFVKAASLSNTAVLGTSQATIVGTGSGGADVFGGQVTWNIA